MVGAGEEVRREIVGRSEHGIRVVAVVVDALVRLVPRRLIPPDHQASRLELRHLPAPKERLDRAGGSRGRRDKGGVPEDDVRQPFRVDGRGVDRVPRHGEEDHVGGVEGGECILEKNIK